MNEAWRSLRVGDRIRITHIPPEFLQLGYTFHDDTRLLCEHLIACGAILTVDQIDEFDSPWISYERTMEDGETEYHSLAVDDDSWESVADL